MPAPRPGFDGLPDDELEAARRAEDRLFKGTDEEFRARAQRTADLPPAGRPKRPKEGRAMPSMNAVQRRRAHERAEHMPRYQIPPDAGVAPTVLDDYERDLLAQHRKETGHGKSLGSSATRRHVEEPGGLMTINLPRCEFTGIERLGCACPACESFTMTDQEKSLRSGVINIRDLEAQVGRPVPEYRMKVRSLDTTAASRRWQQTDLIACDHDSRSTRLCSSCEVLFENLIGDIPALVENLEEAIARNVRFVDHGSSTSPDESPLGLYRAASDALRRLRDTLVYPSEAVRRRDRPDLAAQVATGASRWMLSHWQDVLRHVDIRGVAHRVSLATQRAHRVIDRPRDLMFLGDCPRACGAQLWPERGAVSVACPNEACGWAGSVDELIREWLSTGDDRYLTERELLLALPTLTRRTLGRWIAHEGVPRQEMSRPFWQEDGTLSAKTYMAYRLGSVRELLVEQQLDEQVRATEADGTLTTQQVAQRTGLTEALIWKLVERGRLKPVRVGAKPLRFTVDEVAKLSGRRAS